MDFNCRLSGGFETGTYDTNISDNNWLDYLIRGKTPIDVEFNAKIDSYFGNKKIKKLFGYHSYYRVRTPTAPVQYKVKKI